MLTKEQQEMRKTGIGGSEIASVVGLNPWTSAQKVWARKVGIEEEQPDNPAMERGRFLEPSLLKWVADRASVIIEPGTTMRHKQHSIIIATPDGMAYESLKGRPIAVVEVKAPGARTVQHWAKPEDVSDGIPAYYIPQVMWEMSVAELDDCLVGALISGNLWVYNVRFNQKLFDALLDRAKEFWRYVELKEIPPVQDVQGAKWISEYHKVQTEPELLKLEGATEKEIGEQVKLYTRLNAEVKKQTDALKTLKGQIEYVIGPRAGLLGRDWKVTWKQNEESKVVDWRALAQDLGVTQDMIEKFTITKPGARKFLAGEEEDDGDD